MTPDVVTAADEGPTPELVRELLRAQAPHLSTETVTRTAGSGSSNWVFRLGHDHAVRLPRDDSYVDDLLKETQWLPRLGPNLIVPVPEVLCVGAPSQDFPRPWSVVTWLPGELPARQSLTEQHNLATSLGRFTRSLHAADTLGQPAGADHWGYRSGEPVTERIDAWADEAADGLAGLFDPRQVREAWRRLRRVPPASGSPCWIHTDLSAENLLVGSSGGLVGVIDFGALGLGDRAADLLYAWSLFDEQTRDEFRLESHADEATWLRARAWAFVGPGIRTIESYRHSMAERSERLVRMVETIAAEVGVSLR